MFKLLVLVALVLAVLYFFNWINRRPPGDWRRGDDDEPPIVPTGRLGMDPENRPGENPDPEDVLEEAGSSRDRKS